MAINLYSKASVDSLLSGKLSVSSLSNGAATAIDSTVPTTGKVLSFDGTKLKWVTAASGATWGSITGTLSSQTDLNTALNARVSTAGDTMDNNALLEFNDTFNSTHLGIDGNGVTVESPGLGISANLNKDDLIFTDGVDTASIGLAGVTFADGTTQTTAYTGGGASWLGNRISIYGGYLYDEDSSTYVSGLTLTGASTVNAQNFTLQASGGGVLTFSDATTQATAAIGIPSAGVTGQVLTKNSGTNYDVSWVAPSGVDVQTFGSSSTSGSFTWTKPAGAKWVEFYLVGGGGGGGSGARWPTTSARSGGGSGSGSSVYYGRVSAGALASQETVVVGAGGAGGAGRVADNNNGNPGTNGGATTFGPYNSGFGASGSFGSTTTGTAGAGKSSFLFVSPANNGAGGAGAITFGVSSSNLSGYILLPQGGGGGGGAGASSTTASVGGTGGGFTVLTGNATNITAIAGGTGGQGVSATPATSGTSATTNYFQAGTGGGGGFYRTATAGGAGGAGGWPGGGGGGGGASDNGFTSGAGGAGAHGFAIIITYF